MVYAIGSRIEIGTKGWGSRLTGIEIAARKATGDPGKRIMLLSTMAHPSLAKDVSNRLRVPLSQIVFHKASSGLWEAKLLQNLAGKELFIMHTANTYTLNEDMMQLYSLLVEISKLPPSRRPAKVVVANLYFPYGRQERKAKPREPISAAAMAKLICGVYYSKARGVLKDTFFSVDEKRVVDRLIFVNLHSAAIEGFFPIPVDHLDTYSLMVKFIKDAVGKELENVVVTGPDIGRIKMAKKIAEGLFGEKAGEHLINIAKLREQKDASGKTEVKSWVLGEVRDKTVVIVDDMIDTGGTIEKAVRALKRRGAKKVIVVAVHGVLSGSVIDRLKKLIDEGLVEKIGVVNTMNIPTEKVIPLGDKLVVLNFAPRLASVIRDTFIEKSIVGYQSET